MLDWIAEHSNHNIKIEFEDLSTEGIKRFWCECSDCLYHNNVQFDYYRTKSTKPFLKIMREATQRARKK